MHSQMSVSSPWHFPPLASSTILTRVLFFVQIPHVTEQTPGVQLDHSQSVAKIRWCLCKKIGSVLPRIWQILSSIAHNVIESNLSLPLALHFPSAWQTLSELIHVPCLVPSPLLPLTRQPKYFRFKTKYYWSLISSSIVVLTHPYYIWHTYLFINAGAACGCLELLR